MDDWNSPDWIDETKNDGFEQRCPNFSDNGTHFESLNFNRTPWLF